MLRTPKTSPLAFGITMTPAERSRGRLMRAPDHDAGTGGGKFTQSDIDKAVAAATAKFQESVDRLEAKNDELVGEVRKYKTEARAAKSIDPADFTALEQERDKLASDLVKAQKEAKDAVTRADKAEAAYTEETAASARMLTENALNAALAEAGVTIAPMLKAAKAIMANSAQVVTEGDQRVVKIGDKAVADYVKEWAATDEGKHFVAAPANHGGGAPGGKSGGGSGKTMAEADFNALGPKERSAFMADGGTIADKAA